MSRPLTKAPLPAELLSSMSMVGGKPLFVQVRYNTRRCNDESLANEIADALCKLDEVEFERAWPRGEHFTKESRVLMDAIMVRVGHHKFQHLIDRGFERRFEDIQFQWAGLKPLGVFRE